MKLMIESTGQLTRLDGVPVRLWNGVTEGGVPCLVYVHRVAVAPDQDAAEFERELAEQAKPKKGGPP